MSEHHVAPKSMYFTIFGALMVLTFITVALSYVHLGRANVLAALAVAGVKATLVVLWFMHVKHNTPLIKLTVATGFLWLVFMFAIMFSDYISRGFLGWPQTWGASGAVVHHTTPPPGVVIDHEAPASGHGAPAEHKSPAGHGEAKGH